MNGLAWLTYFCIAGVLLGVLAVDTSFSYSYEVENPNLTKKFSEVISSDYVSDGFFILVFKIAAVLMALMLGVFILRELGKSNPHPR